MRFPLGLLTAGLVAGQMLAAPLAAAQCVRPAEHTSLDVTALKTTLMVTALNCKAEDRYNAFVTKFRPELTSQDRELGGYFSRAHGRSSRKQQDDYVTQLANSRSQDSNRQGSLYCSQNLSTFDEVMALRTGTELADYAAAKSVAQPINVAACGAGSPATVTRASTTRTSRNRSASHNRG